MQDFPDAAELLDAVAAYLFGELRPQVPAEERFKLLVAANVCAVVGREIRAGDAPSRADAELFRELLGKPTGAEESSDAPDAARAAAAELATELRRGALDERLDQAIERLDEHVRRKLDVARPGYAD